MPLHRPDRGRLRFLSRGSTSNYRRTRAACSSPREAVVSAVSKINLELGRFGAGGEFTKGVTALGISLEDASGKARPAVDLLAEIARVTTDWGRQAVNRLPSLHGLQAGKRNVKKE